MELIITLIIVGAVLIFLETILPGLIAGIIGFCCLIAAVYFSYARLGAETGNWVLLGVTAGVIIGSICWLKFFPKSRMARPLISKGTIGNIDAERHELLNQTGTAFTSLRPSGIALINDKRVDVVTEGALLEKGTPLKVVAIEGMRVVVRAI